MRHRLGTALVATASALALLLSGCSSMTPTTVQTCIDWVYFETPADAMDESDAVAIGTVEGEAGTTTYLNMPATVWKVSVDGWVDDGAASADEIDVTSLPRSCGDTGDTMAELTGEKVALFLREVDGEWQLITPLQGVVPATPEGTVPEEWPADQP